ncbi:5'-methylthioadenosine nucleosidase [Bradyrhizobium sp. SYSU BS000235]|uniref:phosphorylase family protein n=1 Tax=Bradyrhizobium sp. SYSU BS000235 TaxID=3411332 RepID=UPI003C74E8AD
MNFGDNAVRKRPILIVTALTSELDAGRAIDGVEVAFIGVGKVNAALATAQALLSEKRALVVNYGTCGKISKNLHGLIEISRVIQRDMMAMPLAPRGVTPFCEDSLNSHILDSGHVGWVCGTGDSFVMSDDPWLTENKVDVVDMELFAIASACKRFGVPWRAFKHVTDSADDDAHDEWEANCGIGAELFWERLNAMLVCDA